MTNLYEEWKKLRDNVQSASVRLYLEKNENTEKKYEEALERLGQFEKENEIPLMADEAEVKKMFCPQTNEEWFCQLPTEEKAVIFSLLSYRCNICDGTPTNQCPFDRCVRGVKDIIKWLKQPHKPIS